MNIHVLFLSLLSEWQDLGDLNDAKELLLRYQVIGALEKMEKMKYLEIKIAFYLKLEIAKIFMILPKPNQLQISSNSSYIPFKEVKFLQW